MKKYNYLGFSWVFRRLIFDNSEELRWVVFSVIDSDDDDGCSID